MQAIELMLGDWVFYPKTQEYCKVTTIHNKYLYCFPKGSDEKHSYGLREESVSPIPLTAEILKKNFKADPYGFYFFGDDYIEVYIKEYTEGLWRVEVNEIEVGGLPTWQMYVSDVHQLQHALCLCGIDKEFEL